MPSDASPEFADERDEQSEQPAGDYDPDQDQDTESTNTAPAGERPVDPEQLE